MQIRYERDDARRRVLLTLSGVYDVEDVIVALQRKFDEQTWHYTTVYDGRGLESLPYPADLKRSVDTARAFDDRGQRRGAVAFVATDTALVGILRMYANVG